MKMENGKLKVMEYSNFLELLTIYTFLTFIKSGVEFCSRIKTVPECFKSFKNVKNIRRCLL